jgi:soluble lytic murein transglycosylase-like protein
VKAALAALGLAGVLASGPAAAWQMADGPDLGQPSRPTVPGRNLGFTHLAIPDEGPALPEAGTVPLAASMRITRGEVYRYVENGEVHWSSARPAPRAGLGQVSRQSYTYMESCFACALQPDVNFATIHLNTEAYRQEIAAAARDFGVDEAVVRAIIHAESAYNPNAISRVGAQGLMQLMPATARRFGVVNVFDIGQNIRGGVQYLAWLLRRFDGNLALAAAGYNAGEGAVDRYGGIPPYDETQRYVQRVAVLAQRYRSAMVVAR